MVTAAGGLGGTSFPQDHLSKGRGKGKEMKEEARERSHWTTIYQKELTKMHVKPSSHTQPSHGPLMQLPPVNPTPASLHPPPIPPHC